MTPYEKFLRSIESAFRVDRSEALFGEDVMQAIFRMSSIREDLEVPNLGRILLHHLTAQGTSDFEMNFDFLTERFADTMAYAEHSKRFGGIEKVKGRDTLRLLGKLDRPQLEALLAWWDFTYRLIKPEWAEDDERREELAIVREWLALRPQTT